MIAVNLIPRQRRERQQRRRRTRAWIAFLRTYCILLAVASGLVMLPAHADSTTLDSTLSRVDKHIETANADLTRLKKEAVDHARALSALRAVGDHPDWSLVMDAVARLREKDITLEAFDLTTTKAEDKSAKVRAAADKGAKPGAVHEVHTIRLSGFAPTPTHAYQFAHRLEELKFADSVSVKDTRSQPLGKLTTIHFEIEVIVLAPAIPPPPPASSASEGGAK